MHHIASRRTTPGKSQAPILTKDSLVHPARPLNSVDAFSPSTASGHDFTQIPVHAAMTIQPKLVINTPGDEYEQEADRISQYVMRGPEPPLRPVSANKNHGQPIERQANEHLRTKRLEANNAGKSVAPPIVHEVLNSSGQRLDPSARAFMEARFGHDFSRVRVHTDGRATEAASAIDARAFTSSRHIVFGAGEYAPATNEGRLLLAHELVHTQQQSARVQPGIQRQTDGKKGKQTGEAGKTPSSPALKLTKKEKHEFISTILAESGQGMDQLQGIVWVYYNNMLTKGVHRALSMSTAFRDKTGKYNGWYKGYMTGLGETDYLNDPLPLYMIKPGMPKSPTFADYVKSSYYVGVATAKVNKMKDYIENTVLKNPSQNPYPGYTNQGYHGDLNNETSTGIMWTMARAYYWLQIAKTVKEKYVTKFEAGNQTTFIFDLPKIEQYYKTHPLPKVVPKWAPGDKEKQ